MTGVSLKLRAALLSALLLAVFVGAWQLATRPVAAAAGPALTPEQIEYQKMLGKNPEPGGQAKASGFPTPADMGATAWRQLSNPFYDNGPNDKGIGLQLAYSLGRVGLGFGLAVLVAVPLGFLIGMSPLVHRALDPFIQVLKPISPLAWMPLALYTIKDSSVSGIFVIFICSIWPMLISRILSASRMASSTSWVIMNTVWLVSAQMRSTSSCSMPRVSASRALNLSLIHI